MAFELDAASCVDVFRAAGFDEVTAGDVLFAWKQGDPAWEVVVDRGGRLKATITSLNTPPQACSAPVRSRQASVLIERLTTITVMFALQDNSELADALQAIEAFTRGYLTAAPVHPDGDHSAPSDGPAHRDHS